jgi:hypothetical protein
MPNLALAVLSDVTFITPANLLVLYTAYAII